MSSENWTPLRPFEKAPVQVAETVGQERAYSDVLVHHLRDSAESTYLAHARQSTMNVIQAALEHPGGNLSPLAKEVYAKVFAEKKEAQQETCRQLEAHAAKLDREKYEKEKQAREETHRAEIAKIARGAKLEADAREKAREASDRARERRSFVRDVICVVLGVVLTLFAQKLL